MPALTTEQMMKGKYQTLTLYFMIIACFGCSSTSARAKYAGLDCASLTAKVVEQQSPYSSLSRKSFTEKTAGRYKIEYLVFSGRNHALQNEIAFVQSHYDQKKSYRILSRATNAAITSNNKYAIKLLLKKVDGLAQRLVRASRMSPFQLVSSCNNVDMLKILLRNGVDMYAQTSDKYAYDALWESVIFENAEVTRYLLDQGFDPCRNYWLKNDRGTYIHRYYAAKQSSLPKALLLRLKCSVYSNNE